MSTMGDPTIPPPPGLPGGAPGGQAPLLQRKIGPVPVPLALGAAAVGLWYFHKRYKAGAAANAATNPDSVGLNGTTTLGTTPYGPYPISASGPFGGGGGQWWGQGTGGGPATNNDGGTSTGDSSGTTPPPPPAPPPPPPPPPALQQTVTRPENEFQVGQQVTPTEHIVASEWDQARGTWLNLTNLGGVYASGGSGIGGTPYGGSYLGYLNSLKGSNPRQYQTELNNDLSGPGVFSRGALQVDPNGNYTLVNNLGQKYGF